MKDTKLNIGKITFKPEYVEELWESTISKVKNMDTTDSDFDNLFSCGIAMGEYWMMCKLLDIDGGEYATLHNIDIIDF